MSDIKVHAQTTTPFCLQVNACAGGAQLAGLEGLNLPQENPSRRCTDPSTRMFLPVLSSSVVSDSATPWTVAHQSPLSVGFSRQEYWSRLPFPPPEDLPDPWIKHKSPVSLALAGGFFSTVPPGKPYKDVRHHLICNSQNPKPPKCPVIKKSDRATEPGKPT